MKEKEILDDLLKNNKITKDEYNKLLRDLKKNKNSKKDYKEETFVDSLFRSIKTDIDKAATFVSENEDIFGNFKKVADKIKSDIIKESESSKVQKLAKKNLIKQAKNVVPVKEQKIVHKIEKNINTFNINVPSDYVTIIGTSKKYIEIVAYFVVDNIEIKDILVLKQTDSKAEIALNVEKYAKYLNANITIMLPHKYIKNINIECVNTTYDIGKINLNNMFLKANNSYLKFKNNKINNLHIDMENCDFMANGLSCNNFSVVSDKTKSNVKLNAMYNVKLNLNNSNFILRGIYNKGVINVKLQNLFSNFVYDKTKFIIIKKEENLSYLRCGSNKNLDGINLDCKIVSSMLKIC